MHIKSSSQPKGLYYLSATESWERFAFYGTRSVLMLYMINGLGLDSREAFSVYATALAIMYATPVPGGIIADTVLGIRHSIILGSCLIFLGYGCLAFSGEGFHLGLALVSIGLGFFKPTVTTAVGNLYGDGKERRDEGFTLFYLIINIGAFIGPLVCGIAGKQYHWPGVFAFSACGLLVGLSVFIMGARHYIFEPGRNRKNNRKSLAGNVKYFLVYSGVFVSIILVTFLLRNPALFDYILPLVLIGVLWRLRIIMHDTSRDERKGLYGIMLLIIVQVIFFALLEQEGCSVMVFSERYVNFSISSLALSPNFFHALNPAFTLLLGLVLAGLWQYLGSRNAEPDSVSRIAISFLCICLAFATLALGVFLSSHEVPLYWLVIFYFFHALGEYIFTPASMALATRLAPRKAANFIMGIWLMSLSLAYYFAGVIARLTSVDSGNSVLSCATGFMYLVLIGIIPGVLPFLYKKLRRLS